jgi:hypothetical protein
MMGETYRLKVNNEQKTKWPGEIRRGHVAK